MFNEAVHFSVDTSKLTHEDLVNIFSDGLYGSSILGVDYSKIVYDSLPDTFKVQDPCYEDKLASIILAGMTITIVDMDTYEEKNVSNLKKQFIEDAPTEQVIVNFGGTDYTEYKCGYKISLADIKRAMEHEDCQDAVKAFLDGNDDFYSGDAILQTAAFGKIIYG